MESAFLSAAAGVSMFSIYKSLDPRSSYPLIIGRLNRRFSTAARFPLSLLHLSRSCSLQCPSILRDTRSVNFCRDRGDFDFAARYTSSFVSGGGGPDGVDGGGGDRRVDVAAATPGGAAAGPVEGFASSSEVIILEVGGMSCGGCAASVKRILESQPQVSSASVNLATETAIVWPVSEAMITPNWKKDIGEVLAKHLTSCGFQSNLKDLGAIDGDNKP